MPLAAFDSSGLIASRTYRALNPTTKTEWTAPIPRTATYSHSLFIIAIAISFFYGCIYIGKLFSWRRRTLQLREKHMEYERLRQLWDTMTRTKSASPSLTIELTPTNTSSRDVTLVGSWYSKEDKRERTMYPSHKSQRRRLFWQWSVAMGFCHYHHGYRINTLIDELLQRKQEKRTESEQQRDQTNYEIKQEF